MLHRSLGTPNCYTKIKLGRQKNCIFVVESKRVTTRVKHIDIPVCFLQENVDNGIPPPKYDNLGVMLDDMCTKPYISYKTPVVVS